MKYIIGEITVDGGYAFLEVFNYCLDIMKLKFRMFGIDISLWQIFLWSIIMYALLRLFFRLFE